jgi:phage terminase Nu1 subunit (DNA packaging protein)
MMDDPTSAASLATLFGISERHVRRLARDGIIPKVARGKYPLTASVRGFIGELQRQVEGSQESIDLRTEQARRTRLQADRLELDLSTQRGEFIHISNVRDVLAQFASRAAAVFQSAPSRIKNRIPNLKPRELTIIKRELAGVSNAIADIRPD